jgi:hypothetical protein
MAKSKNNRKDLLLIPVISLGIAVLGVLVFFVLQFILGFDLLPNIGQTVNLVTPTVSDSVPLVSEDVSPLATPRFQDEDLVVMLVELNPSALIEKVSFYVPIGLINSQLYINSMESVYSTGQSDSRQIFIDIPLENQSKNVELSFKSAEIVIATCNIQVTDTIEISGNCVW